MTKTELEQRIVELESSLKMEQMKYASLKSFIEQVVYDYLKSSLSIETDEYTECGGEYVYFKSDVYLIPPQKL